MTDIRVNREYDANSGQQKLLVLGAGPFQLHLIEKAKEMGSYVIAMTPPGDYPGIEAADKVYFHDAKDEEFAYETAKKEAVNGVTTDQAEILVRAEAYAAEKMGLPGNPYEAALIYTDKHLMRKKCKELGLATIESCLAGSIEEAEAFLVALGGDAIIKPVDSFSSRGIHKIHSEDDLEYFFEEAMNYSRRGKVIIERLVDGPEFEVDSIAAGGVIKPLMYADQEQFEIPDVFSSATRLYPSAEDKAVVNRLLEYNRKVNEGFGMVQGLSHNEYIMDSHTGEIYLIEAALRGGGNYVSSYIATLQTGLDTAEFLVNIALGRTNEIPEFATARCHCGFVCCYLPAGEIISRDGADEVEALDYVVKTTFDRIKLHTVADSIEDKEQRHTVVLYADSREELMSRIDHIRETFRAQVRTGGGIKGPIWK